MVYVAKISVSDTPSIVTLTANTISWTAPATQVSGYEVFYLSPAGETLSAGTTNITNLTLSELQIFVVAYSPNNLPSNRSNTILLGK